MATLTHSGRAAVAAALALATKEMAEPHFAAWLKERSVPLKEPESGRPSGQEN